ncbi:MAG: triose-phosphate isomerase [Patescibacteria group bacterium]
MKRKLIVANWKMNPDTSLEALHLWEEIGKASSALKKTSVVVCPPAIYVGLVAGQGGQALLGAQNCSASSEGARTGEVSASMLANAGVAYVIVGHSERRAMGETNNDVSEKVAAVLRADMVPLVCVGERVRDPDGFYLKETTTQLEEGLAKVSKKNLSKIVIAYEPVWAIGKNGAGPASVTDVLEMVLYIRRALIRIFGKEAAKVPVLYGGSVEVKNAAEFMEHAGIDGLLVGRESLNTKAFPELLRIVDHL